MGKEETHLASFVDNEFPHSVTEDHFDRLGLILFQVVQSLRAIFALEDSGVVTDEERMCLLRGTMALLAQGEPSLARLGEALRKNAPAHVQAGS